VNDLFGLTLQI